MIRTLSFTVGVLASAALLLLLLTTPALAAEPCPNEQLRIEDHSTTLPDCRAYELVTPPFKDGQLVLDNAPALVAADGSRVVLESTGGFNEAGDDSGNGGTRYVASRGVSGWSSLPVQPSAAQSQGVGTSAGPNLDFSSDLQEALLEYAPVGATPVDKRFDIAKAQPGLPSVEVGPAVSPATAKGYTQAEAEADDHPAEAYDGATGDLSHVLFSLDNQSGPGALIDWLWPGDTTVPKDSGAYSLYEYVGSGHSGLGGDVPALVGVSDGRTVRDGEPLAAGELISQCGDELGGQGAFPLRSTPEETYNAISQDGASVFFTARVGGCESEGVTGEGPDVREVYARITEPKLCADSEADAVSPCTVAISDPSKVDCAECDTSEAENPALTKGQANESKAAHELQAVFQGASDDGSRVFFLSKQKLLPGASGVSLYQYSFDFAEEGKEQDESVSLVAPQMAKAQGREPGGVMRVTENGGLVYFVSHAKLADNTDALGREAIEGEGDYNMYSYDTHTRGYVFIAALSEGDEEYWSEQDTRPVEATPDGRFLLFTSVNDLTPDASLGSQLYRYDSEPTAAEAAAHVPQLVRVSIGEDGFNDDGDANPSATLDRQQFKSIALAGSQPVDISGDGSRVFFESQGALTIGALNDACAFEENGGCVSTAENVYEWEQAGAGSCPADQAPGCVFLISDGLDAHSTRGGGSAAELIGADASGENVFFQTADPLVGQDTDTQLDVYDAHVDGGFPAPAVPSSCKGEECLAPPTGAPTFAAPGSASFSGPGNPAPAVTPAAKPAVKAKAKPCKKGFVKNKKNKCVRSKSKRKAKKATNDRRPK